MKETLFRAATDPNTGIFFWGGIIIGIVAALVIMAKAELDIFAEHERLSDAEEAMLEKEEDPCK